MPGAIPQRIASRRRNGGGYSLLEVAVALSILAIVVGPITSSLLAGMSLARSNRETALALEAAASALEAVKAEDFAMVFVRYNANPGDDPGTGVSPGNLFDVPGLNVRPDDPDGFAGEILFPGDGTTLRETPVDRDLGMPRDLNGDSAIDAADHASDYEVLPVRVRVEWTGVSGDRRIEMVATLVDV